MRRRGRKGRRREEGLALTGQLNVAVVFEVAPVSVFLALSSLPHPRRPWVLLLVVYKSLFS